MEAGARTLLAVGDVNPCRHLAQMLLKENINERTVTLKSLLSGADLVIGNLEGPITDCKSKKPGQVWNLRMPPVIRNLLLPFDGFSLANNHVFDFGIQGLTDTFENLDNLGIKYCGAGRNAEEAGRPAIFDVDGFRISMISLTDRNWHPSGFSKPGTCSWRGEASADVIRKMHQTSDFVIVQIHQGYEFVNYPGPEEIDLAKLAVDAGADLVLGHHSHYMMGVLRRGQGVIAYGLGDFLLDKQHIPKAYREKARICPIFSFEISRHCVLKWHMKPCKADEYGWPSLANDRLKFKVQEQFRKLSEVLEDEKKTQTLFRQQASRTMLPYALGLLKHLIVHEGLKTTLNRLMRIRRVDVDVLGNYCRRLIKRGE